VDLEAVGAAQRLRTWLLGVGYALVALSGIRHALFPAWERAPTDVLLGLVFAVLIAMICVADSRALGRPILESLRWVLYLTLPVSVFVYMTWSRGTRGLLVLLGHLAGATVLYMLATLGTRWLAGMQLR
jgi:hypothetical protein